MTNISSFIKLILILPLLLLGACSTNMATGRSQFTGLMSESSEASIGAQEHIKILAQYGGEVQDKALRDYVTSVGEKIVPHTERKDVDYTFTLLDSPVVNAFALPGGYVYVTRGILTLANNEAEMAAVIAHEIGHVTARHSAERYSTSVLTSIGSSIISAAVNVNGLSQALGLGSNLYLSSYSRSQEHEADDLGIRYLSRSGYHTHAMADFLKSLEASTDLEAKETGRTNDTPSYLSTHPVTAERVTRSTHQADSYELNEDHKNRITYLKAIHGMDVEDSAAQGFVDQGQFVHPEIGFIFPIPDNVDTQNSADAFIAKTKSKSSPSTLLFTSAKRKENQSLKDYLRLDVLKGDMSNARDFGANTINGIKTASVETTVTLDGEKQTVRFVVYEWDKDTLFQLSLIVPQGAQNTYMNNLQKSAFGFRRLTPSQKHHYRPKTLSFRVAKSGDTVEKLSKKFPYEDGLNAQRFRVINGLSATDTLIVNTAYKIIVQ